MFNVGMLEVLTDNDNRRKITYDKSEHKKAQKLPVMFNVGL